MQFVDEFNLILDSLERLASTKGDKILEGHCERLRDALEQDLREKYHASAGQKI